LFTETKKYKNNDHFFFRKGDNLPELSKDVPELPGIFYVIHLARGGIDLVYISRSGMLSQTLRDKINITPYQFSQQDFFESKMSLDNIDALDIYWFVTIDKKHNDLPEYVEGLLMQRHYEIYGNLPLWNR
jgi:hypothetical protein